MIAIKFYPYSTQDGEFTVVVMDESEGYPEFHFRSAEVANDWVKARGGYIGDTWEVNSWNNRYAHGEIQSMIPVEGEAIDLWDLEVVSTFECFWYKER